MSAINLQNRNILRFCLYIGLALHSAIALGESQYQAQLNEDKLLLLDTRLNADFIVSSLEAYEHQGQIFVSVEPLFDALSLRYQLYSDRL